MRYCPHFKAALTTTTEDGQKIAVAGRCKQWSCPYCAKRNRDRWLAVLLDHINKSRTSWSWFTLTAHRNAHRSNDNARYTLLNISRAWDRLIKRMRRKYGQFEYCRVYEHHKSGAYHLHAIRQYEWDDLTRRNVGKENEYSDSAWLRKTAANLGMGYMTHAENIGRAKAGVTAFYVVKYMTQLDDKVAFSGVRRIQTSRGIKYGSTSEYTWDFKSGLYLDQLNLNSDDNFFLINEGRKLCTDDFETSHVWPSDA